MIVNNVLEAIRRWVKRRSQASPVRSVALQIEELEPRHVLNRAAVASGIVGSTESFVDLLVSDYAQFLHRAPDAAGLNNLLSQLQQGQGEGVVEAEFVSSTEYILDHGNTATGFVLGLYQDLLGRTPTLNELNFWLGQLGAGASPLQVALGFTLSRERESIIINHDYFILLGRAPDAGGLNFWLSLFQQGFTREQVASGIINSTEFFVDHGSNNAAFIVAVYQDVLLRTPASAELAFWLSVANQP
jgi:Domain of unknown function (DUF4214)